MKTILITLGFVASAIAVVLAVTPLFKIAVLPGITAMAFGILALYFSKQKKWSKKSIHLVILLSIIALSLTTYKSIFTKVEVGNTEELIQKEEASEQDAIETLEDIEIDE